MCYFIAEGYHHTRDVRKYTARLFLFALISHFDRRFFSPGFSGRRFFLPFAEGKVLNQTSVMWSLVWGLVMLRVTNSTRIRSEMLRTILILLICGLLQMGTVLVLPILRRYSGERSGSPAFNRVMKWLCFFCYPLHPVLLVLVQHY